MLRAFLLLALVGAAGRASAKPPSAHVALLQGSQTQATLDSFLSTGAATAGRERAVASTSPGGAIDATGGHASAKPRGAVLKAEEVAGAVLNAEEAAVLRDVVAVSQALQDEMPTGPHVKVEVFTAAGCRECRKVFHRVIAAVLQKEGMMEIVELKMVLWGNGDVVDQNGMAMDADGVAGLADASSVKFSCALHGDATCAGNAWEACLVNKFPNSGDFFPVFNCIEGRACAESEQAPVECYGSVPEVAPVCADEFGEGIVDANVLRTCAEGDEGKALLLSNAQATTAAEPLLEFLPWIIVNGKALGTGEGGKNEQVLLGKAICDAYTVQGGVEPFACSTFPQSLDDLDDPWGDGPTTDDTIGVPSVLSDQSSGVGSGITMLLTMLGVATVIGYCFCEPRTEDEAMFDAIGGRPFSRAGYAVPSEQSIGNTTM